MQAIQKIVAKIYNSAIKLVRLIKQRLPNLQQTYFQAFPAIHIHKMDWLDFVLKFSNEILVIVISALAIFTNFYFFTIKNKLEFKDNSLAAQFLENHINFNRQLYVKNNQIRITVPKEGFIPTASADDFTGISADANISNNNIEDGGLIMTDDNNSFVHPNPDSVSALVAKQIKVYDTVSGDTLKSLSEKFNISQNTIIWANKLSSTTIKPGWHLIILPTNGVLYKATANDTLPDVAAYFNPQKYNSDRKIREQEADNLLDKIISYNLLDNPEDIEPGQIIIVPGGAMVSPPPPPKPVSKPAKGKGPVVPRESFQTTGHLFPWGYCTWYVAKWLHDNKGFDIPWGGNAKNWLANAQSYGAVVSKTPAVGTIVVTDDSKKYGHVAVVIEVNDDSIVVTEMNYKGKGITNQRTISKNSKSIKGYIYR